MAIGKLAPGKKRISITFTEANVERFQKLTKKMGLALTLSNLCDQAVESTTNELQILFDKGTIKMSDIFNLIGRQMDLIQEDNKTERSKKDEKATKQIRTNKQ